MTRPSFSGRTVRRVTEDVVNARIAEWRARGNHVAIGNLGEQVALSVLVQLEYEVLATQDDLKGGVAKIVDRSTRMNPEDFICITPDGRLVTVNCKAAVSERSAGIASGGNLKPARLSRGQDQAPYYSERAGLISPLDGAMTDAQVMKVDLVHKCAQLFDLGEDGTQKPASAVIPVAGEIAAICARYPDGMIPAPLGPNR